MSRYHGSVVGSSRDRRCPQVNKVTILPRTNGAGGFTLFTPSEERMSSGLYSKNYLECQLAVALGGRVVEEMIYGKEEVTTGASGDLQQTATLRGAW